MAANSGELLNEKSGRPVPELIALPDDALMTVEEVASWLRVSIGWVYENSNGKRKGTPLRRVKLGSNTRFRVGEVRTLVRGAAA